MNLKIFLKNFLGFFILCSLVFIGFNMLVRHKSWDEIDHMLNLLSATIISLVVGISKARK
ncbi:hypothetical protein SAMN05518670_3062 [Paenibacillus sp. OK076]|nr:hypothetical protein SAMN05518670_3062 [Paenibacillus sp. OK076]